MHTLMVSWMLATVLPVDVDSVLCFAFRVPQSHDPFLKKLSDYLHKSKAGQEEVAQTQPVSKHDNQHSWYQDMSLTSDMKTKARVFKALAEATGKSKSIKFVIAHLIEKDHTNNGADILLFNSGPPKRYQSPDKPGKPKALCVTQDSIQLEWSKPQQEVTSYTIFTARKPVAVEQKYDWGSWCERLQSSLSSTQSIRVRRSRIDSKTIWNRYCDQLETKDMYNISV